ncbi:DNA directed RNA polymeras-like protein III subunit Rpc82 [Pyrenochaeta sp. DS3sAY3a]|nr:DNA directed RNA polymeras-like protein III subunit Rpc82 [Pyrenochaeta sp. DS3sAY3a]
MSYNQRETPVLAELCTLLVEDVHGELAARVYSVLARLGRQTLPGIVRASYLNARQIKYGLVILLQQHLVCHSGSDGPATYYDIDWQSSYAIARVGKIAKLVQARFGKKSANVMSNLLTLGHTRMADLQEAYFPTKTDSDDEADDGMVNGNALKRKRGDTDTNGHAAHTNGVANGILAEHNGNGAVNGVHKQPTAEDEGDITSPEELYTIVHKLLKEGWIRTMSETQYLSPGDMHDQLQQEAIETENSGITPTGLKDKDRVRRATLRLKREMRDEWCGVPDWNGMPSNYSVKRIKTNAGNGATTSSQSGNTVIRVNPEKISVAMRTEQLVQLVGQRLGPVTAHIYRIVLQTGETTTPRCFDEWSDPPLPSSALMSEDERAPEFLIATRDLTKTLLRLNPDFDFCEDLDPHAIVKATKRGHVEKTNHLSQPVDPAKLSMEEKSLVVSKHIKLLADDPFHFMTWHSGNDNSLWFVEFDEIAKHIIHAEVEKTILSRKGNLGVKLIRALKKKGKLDERAACSAMMMSPNDIRGIVNDLAVQGFVQTQEIPKVDRREAKLSQHLIWYDRQRAREKLLIDTYKGMVRIYQRIAFEREKIQPLLSKAERSDVVGNEEKWLSKGELDALRKWKEVQEKLLLQLSREDDLVATLRDFYGPLVSV